MCPYYGLACKVGGVCITPMVKYVNLVCVNLQWEMAKDLWGASLVATESNKCAGIPEGQHVLLLQLCYRECLRGHMSSFLLLENICNTSKSMLDTSLMYVSHSQSSYHSLQE